MTTTNYKVTNADYNFSDFDDIFMRREFISNSGVYTWGDGASGGLGNGSTTSRSSPGTIINSSNNWRSIAAGGSVSSVFTVAGIKTDGTLWTWGSSTNGALGTSSADRSSPGTVAGGGTNWKTISVGAAFMVGVKTDGTLWTWGSGQGGTLGNGSTVGRSSPGTVSGGGTNWLTAVCGTNHTLALKTDGTLWVWGQQTSSRQLGDGTITNKLSPVTTLGGGTNWTQVAVGTVHSLAIKSDGTLWTWGSNVGGECGIGGTTIRSSPGTVSGGGTDWKQVAGGVNFSAAIKTDGTLWTWGRNATGQLGDGTTTNRSSPVTVAGGGTTWKFVTISRTGSTVQAGAAAAIKTDGTLWTWGINDSGQLGDGATIAKSSPATVIGGLNNWKSVSIANTTIGIVDLSF